MSFLDGLFGGGGGGDTSSGGGGFFGGGGGGGFDLSSIMGGDSGGGLGSLFGNAGNMLGMGNYDPSTQAPTPQQTNQANDPGGQLAGSRDTTDQGRDMPPGKSNQSGGLADIAKMFASLTGQGQQQQGQQGQGPGWITPQTPQMQPGDYTRTQPPVPLGQQPGQQPPGAQPPGAQPPGAQADAGRDMPPGKTNLQGPQGGGQAPKPTPDAKPAADVPKTPNVEAHPGAPAAPGAQQAGGGQQMPSPLQAIVGMLLQSLLGRIGGPYGQMLGQLMSPMLQQLAGQAGLGGQGFGTGMRGPFPDFGGRMPTRLPPNAGGQPTAGPGSPHGPAAPGAPGAPIQGANDQENRILADVRGRESRGNYNLRPDQNYAYPHSHASGGYQFQPRTWNYWTNKLGIGTQYKEAYLAPPNIQDQVALGALRQSGGNPNVSSLWGASSRQGGRPLYATLGGGGQQPQPGYGLYTPDQWRPSDREIMQRRMRRRMSGWAF